MQSTDDKTHRKLRCDDAPRRRWLAAAAVGLAGLAGSRAATGRGGPLLLACDRDVQAAGIATALLRGFRQDTGLAVGLEPGDAREVLDWTESGRCDAVLGASPELAAPWVDQGLLHARRAVASMRWVLVGPLAEPVTPPGSVAGGSRRPPPALGPPSTDVLASLQAMAGEPDERRVFLRPSQATASRLLADALWTQAGLGAELAWRATARQDERLAEEARERQAFAIVGAWSAGLGDPTGRSRRNGPQAWGLLADHDPRLRRPVEILRSFRSQHPAGRLFSEWITGPLGRRALSRLPGVVPAQT